MIQFYQALPVAPFMDIFNSTPQCSHDHSHFTSLIALDVSLNDILPLTPKPLRMHHIHTKLFSLIDLFIVS
jgi:hypothetical protein